MNDATTMVRVDGKFDAELVGAEHDGVLVRELGTQRVDWYQADRVTLWSTGAPPTRAKR